MPYQSIHTGQAIDEGISVNDLQNQRLTDLENKIIPISHGGTGAINAEQALINLSSPKIYKGNDIPDNSLGKDGDIYIKVRQ